MRLGGLGGLGWLGCLGRDDDTADGRDHFSRLLYGGRAALAVAFIAT
jgi:ABC-type dipeptide/oligopeptide/nickel transport system permease subunit